jgi:tRNA dimethylallyltransferase
VRVPASGPLLGIVGPTGSGKTDLALAIARRLPVEILVADSRQVVRGMDVGTATPDREARRMVPHHLLDLVSPHEPFTVAQWVARARTVVAEVAARGALPMLVGGTGLYVAALVDGHDYATQAWAPEVRAALAARLEADGLDPLVAELRERNPEVADRIDLANPRRVVRALERSLAGGAPALPRSDPYSGRVALVGIARPREELYRRIDARARWMFTDGGLLDEVRALVADGHGPHLRAMTGHGYREAIAHLRGELALDAAIDETARRTRQYAKRQLTWFGRDPRVVWIDAGRRPADDPALVERAVRLLRAALS